MSLGAGVRKVCLFVLVFGVLAPRAFADFAVCKSGWEWVSVILGFFDLEIIRSPGDGSADVSPLPQASNSKQQNPCEIAGALEAACQGFCTFESVYHLRFDYSRFSQLCTNWVLYNKGRTM